VLYGQEDDDTLVGGRGNDTLFGGSGFDTFVFQDQWDIDVIGDFSLDPNEDINLAGVTNITSWTDLQNNHLTSNGAGDAVIFDGSSTLTLMGISVGALQQSDFMF